MRATQIIEIETTDELTVLVDGSVVWVSDHLYKKVQGQWFVFWAKAEPGAIIEASRIELPAMLLGIVEWVREETIGSIGPTPRRNRGRDRRPQKEVTAKSDVKYPDIAVPLTDQDGNAINILARVRRAMRDADLPGDEIDAYTREATSGDYEHLLQTSKRWVAVY